MEDQTDLLQRYHDRYEAAFSPLMLKIERQVCGCDFGASSYATRSEVEAAVADLDLRPESRLLDIGCGSGWPALYMVEKSGCRAVLTDVPETGLEFARNRAKSMGVDERIDAISVDAANTGLPGASFDVVTHSDVLCCLPHKEAVLRECRRLVKPGGVMMFSVIYVPWNLAPDDWALGHERGPEFIETSKDYPDLLQEAGWSIFRRDELTDRFQQTYEAQLAADEAHQAELAQLLGRAETEERLNMWRTKADAVRQGVIKRDAFWCCPV